KCSGGVSGVVLEPSRNHRHVRLRVAVRQIERLRAVDPRNPCKRGFECLRGFAAPNAVKPADGTHFDDLSEDEFNPLAIEESEFAELVVLRAGKPEGSIRARWRFGCHGISPPHFRVASTLA